VKRLKVKVRRAYNRRKLGEHYQQDLKRLYQKLLLRKRNAQEIFLRLLLQNEGKSWAEFYRLLKDVKEIGRIYLRSEIVMKETSQIP
jgi:hypothetical protein